MAGFSLSATHLGDVSVVIPTYNRESTVCRAIYSVLGQTQVPGEIIVVDDGSTDETGKLISEQFGDRVVFIRQENSGVAAARNAGIKRARSKFIAFLDSDDIWTPEKIELQLPTMMLQGVVLSATEWRWEHSAEALPADAPQLSPPYIENQPLLCLCRPGGHRVLVQSCICRRDALLQAGGFDSSFRISEDNDLLFRLAHLGALAIVPRILLIRNGGEGVNHLTNVDAIDWRSENLDNMIRILERCLEQVRSAPPAVRRAVRARLATLLMNRAALSAKTGSLQDARRFSFKGLRSASVPSYDFAIGLVGLAVPKLLIRRR